MAAVPRPVSLNLDAVPMQWMQYPIMCMQYVVREDAVPNECGSSDSAVVAAHPAVSLNVHALKMQWMQ